ncbi:hypothetical protein N798_09320 [Knoellia flava TL1]|uniref:Uncharacterized protein n=2 Tax=Knoellia flava TaxID=913969 RepID=A0A8H9FUQ1_9MICO|nr:hypothetical protein [Knoellia flava]KGN31252.1 hypothetical protein N798_09320 [Knoellia flava TL1]GGB88513.1 hypothetical protein GCM10011314_30390 [Knoellia flava]
MDTTRNDLSPATARRITIATWAMAAFGTVAGQLHALSRFNSHPDDLSEGGLGNVWAEPALDFFRPLLDWGDPLFVYRTYGKIWLPICLAFLAAAWLVYRRRQAEGKERWAWRVQLAAYALMTVSVAGDYYTPFVEQFFIVGLVALPVICFGGIWLGILLLRNGFRPRVTAWLVIAFLPFFFAITEVTSMGSALLPLMWGWAIAAQHVVSTTPDRVVTAEPVTSAR